ncbi:hypothetical protein MJ643_27405, partial [Pseudomonas sp. PNPG3]|nr:hypothetical protein [Pseudomonas sp. PNPG3]
MCQCKILANYKGDGMFPGGASTKNYIGGKYARPFLDFQCGDMTYGYPTVEIAGSDAPRKFHIGNYCSIAFDVTIFVGRQGRHPFDTLTTYPLEMVVNQIPEKIDDRAKLLGCEIRRSSYNDGRPRKLSATPDLSGTVLP